jgi:hypothetical protein
VGRDGADARDVEPAKEDAKRLGALPRRLVGSAFAGERRHVRAAGLIEKRVVVVACEILLD